MSRAAAVILAAALLGVAPRVAHAEAAKAREGFIIGFGVGFGATYPCDTCPSFAGNFYVGARTSQRVAVLADFGLTGGDGDSRPGDFGSARGKGLATFALAIQVWPADRVWLRGGFGIGVPFDSDWDDWDDDFDDFDDGSDRSWAAIVGAGYDVISKGRFVMDVHARGAFAQDNQSVAVGLGFNW